MRSEHIQSEICITCTRHYQCTIYESTDVLMPRWVVKFITNAEYLLIFCDFNNNSLQCRQKDIMYIAASLMSMHNRGKQQLEQPNHCTHYCCKLRLTAYLFFVRLTAYSMRAACTVKAIQVMQSEALSVDHIRSHT